MINYSLNGNDLLATYGIRISASYGLVEPLEVKPPQIETDWYDEHGVALDTSMVRYKGRNIQLVCFMNAENNEDYINKMRAFEAELRKPNLQRLVVDTVHPNSLFYMVLSNEAISVTKQFREGAGSVVAEFALNLFEPEPVKRIYKYTGIGTFTASWNSPKTYQVYFEDGTKSADKYGAVSLSKAFATAGDHFIIITGDIDSMGTVTTNATIVWNKLF